MSKFNEVLARNVSGVPKSVCDFSHTVAFSHYNHLSAQLPISPETGKLVDGGIKEQATQCYKNIEAILKGINHVMNDVVRITIMAKSLEDAQIARSLSKDFFSDYAPTMTSVVVKNLPEGALVQIEALITCGEGTIPNAPQAGDLVKVLNSTCLAPKHNCKCSSQSVAFSHYNNISAQYPIDSETGKLVEGCVKKQLKQALRNVKNILEEMDVPFDDIVKVNIFVKDINLKKDIKEAYTTFFPDSAIARTVGYFPALSIIEVADIDHGALVQVETVISHGDGTPPQAIEDRHGIVIKFNNTDKAPRCSVSSQTVAFSHYNNISSQFAIDTDGKIIGTDIETQAKQCLLNIKNIVESIDHKMEDVVKLNVYVKDIKEIASIEKAIKSFFNKTMPAGRIVEVANIDKGSLVQIDAVVSNAEGTAPNHK